MDKMHNDYYIEGSTFNLYMKDMEKYAILSHEELLNEYKNINKKNQILILTDNVLDIDKLFSYITNSIDLLIVANYINENLINKYPQTKEDKKLIDKFLNFKKEYTNNKIDLEKQLELYKKYNESREKVIKTNLRLVISVAKKYLKYCDFTDLISSGNEGLIIAVDRFDTSKNFKFSSYALYWIKNCILTLLYNNNRIIRIPMNFKREVAKITKKLDEIYLTNSSNITTEELINLLGITEKKYIDYINCINSEIIGSINMEMTEDGEDFENFIADKTDPYKELNDCSEETVNYILDALRERDRYVVESRLGINREKKTLQELAVEFKISKQAVKMIEDRSLEKLKVRAKKVINR